MQRQKIIFIKTQEYQKEDKDNVMITNLLLKDKIH
jgi:hypothetical protein